MKIEMRGRWGCGCSMAACQLHQARLEPRGGGVVVLMRCATHDLVASAQLGVDSDNLDGVDVAVTRAMNLLHEEDCR